MKMAKRDAYNSMENITSFSDNIEEISIIEIKYKLYICIYIHICN